MSYMTQKEIKKYGPYRTIDPENTLPNLAWKLDVSLPIRDDEILVRVKVININAASFDQIVGSIGSDPLEIAREISSMVSLRGKLHNPITGTGGTLAGEIEEVGIRHPLYNTLKKGDRVCTLASTSTNPLVIEKIKTINMETRQLEVEGYAILYRESFCVKVPDEFDSKLFLVIVGEAGSCYESALRCRPDSTVMLIAPTEKIGMMSLFALREKLGNTGYLITVTRRENKYEELKQLGIADQVILADFRKPLDAYQTIMKALPKDTVIDYTVDCASSLGNEMLPVLLTRECGTVYYANPAAAYSEATLGAEGIGKEIDLLVYRGYIKGHVAFCMRLIHRNPKLLNWFKNRYSNSDKKNIFTITSQKAFGTGNDSLNNQKVVVSGPEMEQVVKIAKRVAVYDTTVLINGESGTGKEVVADIIQQMSERKDKPFIKINCAAITESLFESEFFGYDSGAFTGALKGGKAGHFENADGGTLFLDEVGELSLQNQVKLLRVLQSKEVVRVGASKAKPVDVRLIAATNRNLREMVNKGTFREDLFYRLNVINIPLPPLRERKGDIVAFIENFTQIFNDSYKLNKSFSAKAVNALKSYSWPGNVRELENMIQRLVLTTEPDRIDVDNLPDEIKTADYSEHKSEQLNYMAGNSVAENSGVSLQKTLQDTPKTSNEEDLYREAAKKYRTTREIAAALNTSQPTVVRRLKKYGIKLK